MALILLAEMIRRETLNPQMAVEELAKIVAQEAEKIRKEIKNEKGN